MIYLAEIQIEGGPIKIGCSHQPKVRISSIQTHIPWVLSLLGTVEGNFPDETRIHWMLRRHTMGPRPRQWYAPHAEVMAVVDELLSPNFCWYETRFLELRRAGPKPPTTGVVWDLQPPADMTEVPFR